MLVARATGGAPPAAGTTVVSLFAYENPAVDTLLAQWRDGPTPVVALVPAGRVSPAVARFSGSSRSARARMRAAAT